jgi:hypothetical protein
MEAVNMIGFDTDELNSRDSRDKSCYNSGAACITFALIFFVFSIFMAANCESVPSSKIMQDLLNKKVEYITGYFDNNNLIPTWQKKH